MGRGPGIHPDDEKYIIGRALDKKNLNMRAEDLAKKVQKELLNINKSKRKPPAVSTMTKMISRTRHRAPSPEEAPWHMGTFNIYAPSAVGLATIAKAYRFALRHKVALTIRQARWIARLRPFVEAMYGEPPGKLEEDSLVALSIIWGCSYANDEIWHEVIGEAFDTTELDRSLVLGLAGTYYSSDRLSPVNQYYWEEEAVRVLRRPTDTKTGIKEWQEDPVNRAHEEYQRVYKEREGDEETRKTEE
jgi:hypothetical protein